MAVPLVYDAQGSPPWIHWDAWWRSFSHPHRFTWLQFGKGPQRPEKGVWRFQRRPGMMDGALGATVLCSSMYGAQASHASMRHGRAPWSRISSGSPTAAGSQRPRTTARPGQQADSAPFQIRASRLNSEARGESRGQVLYLLPPRCDASPRPKRRRTGSGCGSKSPALVR